MECVMGACFTDFVLMAADRNSARSIMSLKHDVNKLYNMGDHTVMAVAGDGNGDAEQFAEYTQKNVVLYKMRNGYELSTPAAASFTRRQIADSLRSGGMYMVNLLIGGFDSDQCTSPGSHLYYLDYLGSMAPVKFGAHGYGSFFSLSVFDRNYSPKLSRDQAYALMSSAIDEVKQRFVMNMHRFKVICIDKNGVHELPDIIPA